MAIKVTQLAKSFEKGKNILESVSFSVQEGEIVTFLGASGCGKSTLLRILAGLEGYDDGEISLTSSPSFVFQQPLLLSWRTALENVTLPLELTKKSDFKTGENCLELVGLKDAAKKYPEQLSGGMKMRVSLARALVTSPKILLLDEPFAALDELTREKLNEELLKINLQQKLSIVLVTHNIFEAAFMSDRIFVLGNSPATIVEEIVVDLPRPREIELRGSAKYAEIVGKIQTSIRKITS